MLSVVLLFVLVSGVQGLTRKDCPDKGRSDNGHWIVDNTKDVPRCVLKCHKGYEPDNCHVLRRIEPDTWNQQIPHCIKESWIRLETMVKAGVAVAAGAGAVAAAPVVLTAAGFTSAGVAAGSIAAGIQGSAVAAGGLFATLQSAGAAGLTAATQAGLFTGVSAVTGAVSTFFGVESCEAE